MDTSEDIISSVPSPVPHLIEKNHMPSTAQERALIKDGIGVANAELTLVEDELERLERMVRHLEVRKTALNKFKDEHQRLINFNPTNYLPKEIWIEIFMHHLAFLQSEYLPQYLPKGKPDATKDVISSFHPTHGPLLLMRVCRTWRKIMLNTAGFWSKIRIVLDRWHMTHRTLELLDLWHARSRAATLDIQLLLYYAPEYSPEASAHKTEVLQKLATQSHRWEKLYLVAPPSYVSKGLWTIRSHLPQLRKCIIHCPDNTGNSWLARELGEDIFEIAPRLDTLILDNSLSLLKNLRFPYHQLTSLDVKRCLRRFSNGDILSPYDCIELLRVCPQLKRCKLTCGYWDGREVPDLTHDNLEELRLYGATQGRTREFGDDGIGVFLECLNAPMLTALSLDLRSPSSVPSCWECTQLCGFLERCHKLKHLSITAFEPLDTPKDLMQYLISSPEYLEFDFWLSDEVGEEFLDELEGYLHDETGALHWLPDRVHYSYIPDRLEHMVVGTRRFFEDEELGGYVYRASTEEIVDGWKFAHACCAPAFSFVRDERCWDSKRPLPLMFV